MPVAWGSFSFEDTLCNPYRAGGVCTFGHIVHQISSYVHQTVAAFSKEGGGEFYLWTRLSCLFPAMSGDVPVCCRLTV